MTGGGRKESSSPLVKYYLVLYNTVQCIGWAYIFVQFITHVFIERRHTNTLWERVGTETFFFQMLCSLEVLHAASGIVPSNPVMTFLQVFGRCLVVGGAIEATPSGKLSPGLPLALFCWSATETIRYSYYVLHLLLATEVPHFMLWLRYTIFIPMYPCGFLGEILCGYWAQSYFRETGKWSLELPNSYNLTFSFYIFMWLLVISYLPLFPQMYLHMFSQRRKALGGAQQRLQQKVQ